MEQFATIFIGALIGNMLGNLIWKFFKGDD